jgi:uncharacterized membrane protein
VAIVALLTLLGAALRLKVAGQSLFADELSTYWIVSTNGLGGVVSTVHTNAEITPPLYFVLAWLTTQIELTPELVRAPSLVAGIAVIPVTCVLGLRALGRAAALVATALVTLSPFMIFYSAEARAYGPVTLLVLLSTLALLAALDDGRARWWAAYGACSCAAVYGHYTAVFVLGAQLLWVLWAHPEARRAALLANAGAVVAFLPWLSGLVKDMTSPTTDILSSLEPLTLHNVRVSLEHWSVGYPYAFRSTALRNFPGEAALVLLVLGVAAGVGGLALAAGRPLRSQLARLDRRLVLVLALALATPVGELLASVVGTNLFSTRNLALGWPGFALSLAALLVASRTWLRFAAVALVTAYFAIAAEKMVEPEFARPDFEAAAAYIDRTATPADVVIDGARFSPGPVTALDAELERPHTVFRVGMPEERTHPFGLHDRIPPVEDVTRRAVAAAGGGRLFVLASDTSYAPSAPAKSPLTQRVIAALPPGYRRVETRTFPGILKLAVLVYARRASPRG